VLEEIFGTGERIKILRVLTRYPKEYTSRELSGYCGVSVRGTIDILTLFERYGFIKSRRVGKSILWKLNENHHLTKLLIMPTFKAEKYSIENLKREISMVVKKFPVENAVIYGSVARGDERPDSDIDLLLVVKKRGKFVDELQNKLRGKILEFFGNTLSILVCTEKEYKKISAGLKKELEKGIIVFGD
jgi:predicted nucleotidyltransferase